MSLTVTAADAWMWVPAAIALISALWLLTGYRGRIAGVGAAIRRQTSEAVPNRPTDPERQAASIVVVASDDAEALSTLLGKIFDQEWEGEKEVIVVNDGKNDDIKDAVTRLKHQRRLPNLLITFTPPGLRNISHRKLSLTLGIKAAHHPVIITLTEQSRLYSTQWLSRMMAPFGNPDTEVVIGSALPAVKYDKGRGARYRSFTLAHDAAAWLSAALGGEPWRGHRCNMAFTRELFFRSGGFNSALNLRDGDDDIFISKICRRGNSAVVCGAQAAVRYTEPSARTEFRFGRSSRMFTSRGLGRGTARFFGASSLAAWAMLAGGIGAGVLGYLGEEWIVLGAGIGIPVGTWVGLALTWRGTLKALRCRPAALMVYPMILRRPLTNLRHRLRSRAHRTEYKTTPA